MAVKKTAKKKAAKKTYPSTKKTTVPKLKRRWTSEELSANLAEIQARMDERHAKTEASIDRLVERHAQTEASIERLSENHAKTEAAIERLSENHAKTEAAIERLSENHAKTEAAIAEAAAEVKRVAGSIDKLTDTVNELSKNIGCVNNKLGSLAEYVVIPQIRHSINTVGGHSFTNIMPDTKIRDVVGNEKKTVAQIDVFLYNDTEAMAVEIKTDLHISDVNDHLKRLQKIRKYEEKLDVVHKKLFGAVVGVVINGTVRKYALENGLYVVKIHEDEELLDIEKPETCRTW